MAQDFVRIQFEKQRLKLRFKHKDIRDACKDAGKTIGDLLGDPFAGWPYLLKYGLRAVDPLMSLDKASDLMDLWVEVPDPTTEKPRTLADLQQKLTDALTASKFVTITAELSNDEAEPDAAEDAEGNDQPEAAKAI